MRREGAGAGRWRGASSLPAWARPKQKAARAAAFHSQTGPNSMETDTDHYEITLQTKLHLTA